MGNYNDQIQTAVQGRHGEVRMDCPACEGGQRGTLGVNVDSGRFHCFRCELKGNLSSGNGKKPMPEYLWAQAEPVSSHPYLEQKGVKNHGLRLDRHGNLVEPFEQHAQISTIQFIDPEGKKRFLSKAKGGVFKGSHHRIPGDKARVCYAEGYATAASIHEATGVEVIVVGAKDNFLPVLEATAHRYTDSQIVVAADNDASGAGLRAAEKAAQKFSAKVAMPETVGQDFNDLFLEGGPDAVVAALIAARESEPELEETRFNIIEAGTLISTDPPPADPVIEAMADLGDKLLIVGPTKTWKTFFILTLCVSLGSGRRFLNWEIPKARRVCLINFEITPRHMHKRIRGIARAMGIRAEDLEGRFHILNARGLGITGPAGLEALTPSLMDLKPEVVLIDPLYKFAEGDENHAEDAKVAMAAFDKLALRAGAMIGFVHHDPKGFAGDRNIRDRGAGSNVVARDYDACFALTPHASAESAVVVDTLLRNYPPQEPVTIVFENRGAGFCFYPGDGLAPEKQTSKSGKKVIPFRSYTGAVEAILNGSNEMNMADFKEVLKEKAGFSNNKLKEFMGWATGGESPLLCTRSERSRGKHDKYVWMNTSEGANPRLDFNEE